MKVLVGAFNKEKGLVGAFFVIDVKLREGSFCSSNGWQDISRQNTEQPQDCVGIIPIFHLLAVVGGFERWFNLTVVNISEDDADDYTCVGVNAGKVIFGDVCNFYSKSNL